MIVQNSIHYKFEESEPKDSFPIRESSNRNDEQWYIWRSLRDDDSIEYCISSLQEWKGSLDARTTFITQLISLVGMDKREYTPVKSSKILTPITNTQATSSSKAQEWRQPQPQADMTREYEALRQQVRALEQQGRQLSGEADRLRYEKSIFENKYLQKASFEEEAMLQCQKEKNYQLELMRLKGEEDANRLRRDFESRLDELHRDLKAKDYHVRDLAEKNAYLDSKAAELRRAAQELEGEQMRARETAAALQDRLAQEEFRKKKLTVVIEELEGQRCEMEAEIHILLDIEAEKSQAISSLQMRLRSSEEAERTLHEKLAVLTDNFAALEEHISVVKERLLSADLRNQQGEQELMGAEEALAGKEESVAALKELEVRLREELEREQAREARREREVGELIAENNRLFTELEAKQQRLHQMCISQGIDI